MDSCLICGHSAWDPLPNPQAARTVLSDLRVIGEPLDKWTCRRCGVTRRRAPASPELFQSGYALYDHAPEQPRETARQEAYAEWIVEALASPPASVLDVGCGNGSLLLALGRRWPGASLRGIDPSPESTARARAAGIDAVAGTLDTVEARPADVVISVNVVEHTIDPAAFVDRLSQVVAPDGRLLLICPDGRQPWLELVFADHMSSFVPEHLGVLLDRGGWSVDRTSTAPPPLGRFMMVAARRGADGRGRRRDARADTEALARVKGDYLQRWRTLDDILLERAGPAPLVCFGIGEAAGLLRAYAPRTWSRVEACVADDPEQASFGDLTVTDVRALPPGGTAILGVRPSAQPALSARLADAGYRPLRWDDVIPA